MKNILSIILIFISILDGNAQEIMNLTTKKVTRGKENTLPLRTIKEERDGVSVTYKFDKILLLDDSIYKNAKTITVEGFWQSQTAGTPSILSRWDTFLVSDADVSVVVEDSSYIDIPMVLSPARSITYNSTTPKGIPSTEEHKGFYPSLVMPETRKCIYRGISLLSVCVAPVQYDYTNKKIRFFNEIRYRVKYNETAIVDSLSHSNKFPSFESRTILKNTTLNNYLCDRADRLSTTGPYFNTKYLIITVPKYKRAVEKFAEWKKTLGYGVYIAEQESWDTVSVKNTIRNIYNTTGLEYLLFFGGQNDIPALVRDKYYNNEHHIHPTDLYYGCINGGYTPDIYRGRILVNNEEEAMTVVDKIISYEKDPVSDNDFYRRGIHCAYFEDEEHIDYNTMTTIHVDGYEDRRFVLTSERIRNRMLSIIDTVKRVYYADSTVNPQYWNYPDFANGESIPMELRRPNYPWNGDHTEVIRQINNKAFYLFMRGHGFINSWYKPFFSIGNISTLSNGSYLPVVFSICCNTGRFMQSSCFCERFLKKENGGCVAIFGATDSSISGPNDVLAEAMFDAVWPSTSLFPQFGIINGASYSSTLFPVFHLGKILDQGLRRCDEAYLNTTKDWYPRYTSELFHCFGDPSMMINTAKPQPFSNASVTRANGTIHVDTGGTLANISFYNRRTGEVNAIIGFSHDYPDDPETSVCISAHNKIPYIDSGTLYIQGKTFANSETFESRIIKVGNHVSSDYPHGDVIFTQGSYTLIGNEVELHPGTTVSEGVNLEIKNQ